MADPPKKFTFGFSKIVKKSNLVAPPPSAKEEPKNVQFIECLEENSIKLKDGEEENQVKAPLVIPIIGPRKSSTLSNGRSIAEIAEDFSDVGNEKSEANSEAVKEDGPAESIEAMAARELLQEGLNIMKEKSGPTVDTLPLADDKEELQRESTQEDYENIPVTQFGLAMLRGMGWKEDEGIGKNKKLVPVTAPVVRPKGMGLGADKMMLAAAAKKAASANSKQDQEELKLVKGAYVKIAAGMNKDQYGQVEGFTDGSGRVMLKMAIGGRVLSVNEATVFPVTKDEYSKYSKVLNASKFDEFKKKEETGEPVSQEKSRRQSPSPTRVYKKKEDRRNYSPKREQSPIPKKDKHRSRSNSVSPDRYDRKKSSNRNFRDRSESPDRYDKKTTSNKGYRDQSESPERSQPRRRSPEDRRKHTSSRRRDTSPSPDRTKKQRSRKSRSRSRSRSKDLKSQRRKKYSDSDSDSKSHSKKKKKHKEKRYSSPEDSSRSRSRSPKSKKKSKKSRRSRSRTPSKKYR
ncbi:G-patch domain and KOW motifs-containing protein [Thrips palmi]|uniref:G-patch domain and KOW motifs-containing protein n=1 Tax=Thrips palmi TaxID=161013 RepID=A0A6P8Z066_THRPL|nr:G-patch domain and KOW motifs-containing protein [Thrips palmi]XP_034243321.1 G-patch domain and KOW motifs-containing protein [Thrips palmi]XP_034243322.1 G-patch domain and KOW motifs-containing protein [Thrips palmi]